MRGAETGSDHYLVLLVMKKDCRESRNKGPEVRRHGVECKEIRENEM